MRGTRGHCGGRVHCLRSGCRHECTLSWHAGGHGGAGGSYIGEDRLWEGDMPLLREASRQSKNHSERENNQVNLSKTRLFVDLTQRFPITAFPCTRSLQAGVIFAKGYRATRLWDIEEEGMFPTLERSSQSSTMKKTFPRVFGPVDPHFTRCRGVVLRNKQDEEVRQESNSIFFFSAPGVSLT